MPDAMRRVLHDAEEFTVQGLAEILSCCAAYGKYDRALLEKVSLEVVDRAPKFVSKDMLGLTRVTCALRKLDEVDHEYLQAVSTKMTQSTIERLSPWSLCVRIWAYKSLGNPDQARYQKML
eukprot:1807764-Amphidinium_carterae.1